MSEIDNYEAQKKKLDGLCEEHDFTYRFRKDEYPITLTISPIQGAGVQLSMLDETEGQDYISPNASMTWIFADGELTSKVSGGIFTISKTLRTKIENILLKMISFWQQYFFRDVIENKSLKKGTMPVIDEDEADDSDEFIDDNQEDAEDQEEGENTEADPEDPADEAESGEESNDEDEEEADDDSLPDGAESPALDEDTITAATLLVRGENKASIRLLAQRLKLSISKSARLMDELERLGVVGPHKVGGPREVLPYDQPED